MKCGSVICAVVLTATTMLHGGHVWGQEAEQPLRRSLTVEQAAIYDVRPTIGVASHGEALQVVAWVDRPDYTYAIGEEVRLFVETNQRRLRRGSQHGS